MSTKRAITKKTVLHVIGLEVVKLHFFLFGLLS